METLDLKLPRSWQELSDRQLMDVYGALALGYGSEALRTHCLVKWSGMEIACRLEDAVIVRIGKKEYTLTYGQIVGLLPFLSFLDEMPDMPVRPSRIGNHKALPADFQGVPFSTLLIADNLHAGFIETREKSPQEKLATVLYSSPWKQPPDEAVRISLLYWMTSLKRFLSLRYPHIYRQPSKVTPDNLLSSAKSTGRRMQEAMDAQIRALTKGDVTKEKEVLALDCWRALTELDALAREAEEIRRISHS